MGELENTSKQIDWMNVGQRDKIVNDLYLKHKDKMQSAIINCIVPYGKTGWVILQIDRGTGKLIEAKGK